MKSTPNKLTAKQTLAIACEYAVGLMTPDIARDYGVSKARVCTIAKEYNIPRRGWYGPKKVDQDLIIELYELKEDDGRPRYKVDWIAHVCNTDSSYVCWIANRSGLHRYNPHQRRSRRKLTREDTNGLRS